MDRFAALTVFVAVSEQRGFASASRHLGISPPAVTRTIAALEQQLGVSLFRRSTRSVALTSEGAVFLEQAREILLRLQEAEHAAMGGQAAPRGELYVTAPVVFGRLQVLPVVAALLAAHPDLSVRLQLLDRNVRLVEEGIDVAVRIGGLRDSSLKALSIGAVQQILVASPSYCDQRGRPVHPQELARHDIVAGDNVRTGTNWRFGPGLQITVRPRLTVTSIDAQLAAVAAGLGIANVLSYQAAEGLADGTLCTVLGEYAPVPLPVSLLFDVSRAQLPAVRLFIAAMRERAASNAWPATTASADATRSAKSRQTLPGQEFIGRLPTG